MCLQKVLSYNGTDIKNEKKKQSIYLVNINAEVAKKLSLKTRSRQVGVPKN